MLDYLKSIGMAMVFTGLSLLYAEIITPMFGMEKGLIVYDIYGGGAITPETNLTLEGNATLRFGDFGKTLLSDEEGIVVTSGALKSKQSIKNLQKQDSEVLLTVDFKNEKIHERKNSIAKIIKKQKTVDLTNTGQEEVAGVICDVWEGHGIRKCLYKGIPLKMESDVLGISYHKVARIVAFDSNSTDDAYSLPDYPIEDFSLFNSAIKTKNKAKAKCFTDELKDVANIVEKKVLKSGNKMGIGKKEKTAFLNKIGQKIYENQKEILPELLLRMKETRECLQTVEDTFDTNKCLGNLYELKAQLGMGKNESLIPWDKKRKIEFLDKLEDSINDLQSRMPCIERAKNITDLSACMK